MMSSRLLKATHDEHHGRLYNWSEHVFDGINRGYAAGLRWVLRHQAFMIGVVFATIALTGYLFIKIPKGFFPQQDTGQLIGIAEGAQDISIAAMAQRQLALADIVGHDPGVGSFGFAVGPVGGSQTGNVGRFWIGLKPRSEREESSDQIITRLRPQLARVPGVALFLQTPQDLNLGGRISRTQYQYTLQDADLSTS